MMKETRDHVNREISPSYQTTIKTIRQNFREEGMGREFTWEFYRGMIGETYGSNTCKCEDLGRRIIGQ